MKIAVASEGSMVSQHFGHCSNFNIFESENGKIISSISIQNGDHENGCVPDFLYESGVSLIITGGIGGGAVEKLKKIGINVIMGAKGDAKTAAETYFAGTLKSTDTLCGEHQHGHEHGGHSCGGHHHSQHDGHHCGNHHGENHQCHHGN